MMILKTEITVNDLMIVSLMMVGSILDNCILMMKKLRLISDSGLNGPYRRCFRR